VSLSGHFAARFAAPNMGKCGEWDYMRQKDTIALGILAVCCADAADAADSTDVTSFETAMNFSGSAILSGYRAAPALMLGLAMLLAIPLMAVLSRIFIWSQSSTDATRRYRQRIEFLEQDVSEDITGDAPQLPGHAFLEVVGGHGARFTILRDMLRIGREEDNDIRIPSGAVHRYHAAIHRVDLGAYRITDLSGVEGNGVVVNGQRCADARLHDGDMIELGPGRLRFHAGLL
jgi:FHA domain